MSKADPADAQLERILYLIPAAAGPDGAPLAELARILGESPARLARDAAVLFDRGNYTPAGEAVESNVGIEADRVRIFTPGEFRRPPRLTAREGMAAGLALRARALDADADSQARLLRLAESVERLFVWPGVAPAGEIIATSHAERPAGDAFDVIREALRSRRQCSLRYLKVGGAAPEARRISPYALVQAERWWYAIGHCHTRAAVRAFRLDRVLGAQLADDGYDIPADFDPRSYIVDGRLLSTGATEPVRVRYSARIAQWIRERYPDAEICEDGGVEVNHAVADRGWIVRHVLQFGAEAEVLEPRWVREAVCGVVERMLAETVTPGSDVL